MTTNNLSGAMSNAFTHPFTGKEIFVMTHEPETMKVIQALFIDLETAKFREDSRRQVYPFIPEDLGFIPVKDSEEKTIGYSASGGVVLLYRGDAETEWWVRMKKSPESEETINLKVMLGSDVRARETLKALGIVPEDDDAIMAISVPTNELDTLTEEDVKFDPEFKNKEVTDEAGSN